MTGQLRRPAPPERRPGSFGDPDVAADDYARQQATGWWRQQIDQAAEAVNSAKTNRDKIRNRYLLVQSEWLAVSKDWDAREEFLAARRQDFRDVVAEARRRGIGIDYTPYETGAINRD